MDISTLTIKSFLEGLKAKTFSAQEITEEFLNAIRTKDVDLQAYLTVFESETPKKAEAPSGTLAGVPLAIKDNMLFLGMRTTAASKILESYEASYDATVVQKLNHAGAVILGKTNLDEFAMGSSTENSAFQVTKNPYDLKRTPGGSSGGSAVAVAAGMALGAFGSDTGGSIRQPAAFCGVVGLKPTYGAVSRFGLIAMASSLDQIGPFTKTVEDAAILFDAIRGKDEYDSTSVDFDFSLSDIEKKDPKQLTIGIPKEYFTGGLESRVEKEIEVARKVFERKGFKMKEISLPNTKYALSVYYIIMPAEVSANLARFDGIRYARIKETPESSPSLRDLYFKNRGLGFGTEARRRILLGTFVLSSGYYDAYYAKAQKVRHLIKEDFDRAFKEVDILFAPTTPTTAFKIGEKIDDPMAMYLSDVFTIPANLAGVPAISIPVRDYKIEDKKLPVGFQLIGKHFHEADILSLGMYYEKNR
ncbi:MAG: Asp-tRNA(Asn)/Glu-tRNA(Gln) amidotransferase subunit GatA [Patescibacteria group bacterium]